jgi:hypothetical protein
MSTKPEGLALMRVPFPANQISYLPKGGTKLAYVGHAALTDRLLDVDPAWSWEPLALGPNGLPALDESGGLWIRLTVLGVTRLGYGDAGQKKGGDAMKERIGDALRNAGMRFGAALDLWHKGELHANDGSEARAEWLAARKAEIAGAKTAGDLKKIMAAALETARAEGDEDAENQLLEAGSAKAAAAKPKLQEAA